MTTQWRVASAILVMLAAGGMDVAESGEQAVFDAREFGAKGDGTALDTQAIQRALDACGKAGGGIVAFPPGTYKAGTLYPRSHTTLRLDEGATLLQSRELKDYVRADEKSYVHHTGSHHAFLHGVGVEHVALVGPGKIDGNKGDVRPGRDPRGPLSVIFEDSRHVRLEDLTVENSPGWSITFSGCQHVQVLGVKCLRSFADGINPACCQHVLYDGVVIDGSGDDPIAIKNDSTGYAYDTRPPCGYLSDDIVIRNTAIRNTGHPSIKLGTGTYGVFRNITVENCTFENTGDMFTIQLMRPKYEQTPERVIEKIRLANITVRNVGRIFDVTEIDVTRPIIRDISFENIAVEGVREPSVIYGLPEAPIRNLRVRGMTVTGKAARPWWLRTQHVHGLRLSSVRLQAAMCALVFEHGRGLELDGLEVTRAVGRGPLVRLNQARDVVARRCGVPAVERFMHARGDQTTGIRLEENDLGKVRVPLDAAEQVGKGAVAPAAEGIELSNLSVSSAIKAHEPFEAKVTVRNPAKAGAWRAEVALDGKAAGARWLWLKQGESRDVTLATRRCYRPGRRTIGVGPLAATGEVKPTPAALQFGEQMEIQSPAAAGELTRVTVPLTNIGGETGTKKVQLLADGKPVASKSVTLGPGDGTKVTLEHRFAEAGPRALQVGDFPVWPYATFANTTAHFYLTRKHIIIEAGGGRHHIRTPAREYAALYLKGVEGDFDAEARLLSQRVTGPYSGGGPIVKNDMTRPSESVGSVVQWRWLKYNVAASEHPVTFRLSKRGSRFRSRGVRHEDLGGPHHREQDVGLFATANSARGELCRVVFDYFRVKGAGGK